MNTFLNKKNLLTLLFIVSFFGFVNQTEAQQGCEINTVSWDPINTTNSIEGQYLKLRITTSGDCNNGLKVEPHAKYTTDDEDDSNVSYTYEPVEILKQPNDLYLPNGENNIIITYKGYEDRCYYSQPGLDCKYYVVIKNNGSVKWPGKTYIDAITTEQELDSNYLNGVLFASCGDSFWDVCDPDVGNGETFDNSWEFFESNIMVKDFKDCLLTKEDISFTEINNKDDDGVAYISGSTISLKIKTKSKCTGIPLKVYLKGFINNGIDRTIEISQNQTGGDNYINVIAEENKDVVVNFISNDNACYGSLTPDCWTYVIIETADGNRVTSTYDYFNEIEATSILGYDPALDWFSLGLWSLASTVLNSDFINTPQYANFDENINFQRGVFLANCDGLFVEFCNSDNWIFKSMVGGYGDVDTELPQGIQVAEPEFDESSPCFDPDTNSYDDKCYEFLAPIPGLGDAQLDDQGRETGRRSVQLTGFRLGDYINTMFQVALGILMVLSVVMIVVAGVQYMTSEAIFQKQGAKESIGKAVAGLILGLGIVIILNTINPELLEVNFGKDIDTVRISTVVDPAAVDGDGSSLTVSNAPATDICNNRKDRGYWLGQSSYKLTKIGETASTINTSSLVGDNINFKPSTLNPQGTNISRQAEAGFATRVKSMIEDLNEENITTRITESFGPSFLGHGSPCHYLGSCIDLATGTSAADATYSTDDVEKIIRTADENGLTAQFEFSRSQSESSWQIMQRELETRGIDACMIKYVTGATNWHFSIYDKINPELNLD